MAISSGGVGGGGKPVVVQTTTPTETNVIWIDTANGSIAKYYDTSSKTWKPIKAVWG